MALQKAFADITLGEVHTTAEREHGEGSRFVQMLCTMGEHGIDVTYSYMAPQDQAFELRNYRVMGVSETDEVPSVTDLYLSAFPFENEAHDLFGLQVKGIAIDFAGNFYKVAMDKPMTVISPEQKAAREKAAKLAAAKAAKEAKAKAAAEAADGAAEAPAAPAAPAEVDWEAERAKVEAKCANLDEGKAAKVMAAFEAKMKRAQEARSQEGGE